MKRDIMKRFKTALAVGYALLFIAPALADEPEVKGLVAEKAAILELLHRKAKKALVNAAQDSSFSEYFTAHSNDGRSRIKERIDQISLNVQNRFHVEEMCLINLEGAEVSRIVDKEIADDLALDEADAPFFKPGFEQKPRKVYISPTYLSPDAGKWVIAYVTPILVANEKKAILHYEHTLAVYQDALNKGMSGDQRFIVAVNTDGLVVSDSRERIPVEKRGTSEEAETYFKRFEFAGMTAEELKKTIRSENGEQSGVLSDGGSSYFVAYETVEHWTLFVFEKRKLTL